jgi:D-beta-D-heptose 7-phosphate kinase/D-beta-D-heptose 1-phosphate adenosyltransferase
MLPSKNELEGRVLALPDLLAKLEEDRAKGKKLIFTNGCFDILHRGHVAYLRAAKALGDRLVIGLNTDASVRRLKGDHRPINSENDRAFMLESLRCVDYIVKFDEDTPYQILSRIKPDILVKGGDYNVEEVAGRKFAGKVQLIKFVEGYSTTKTIKKIKQQL